MHSADLQSYCSFYGKSLSLNSPAKQCLAAGPHSIQSETIKVRNVGTNTSHLLLYLAEANFSGKKRNKDPDDT